MGRWQKLLDDARRKPGNVRFEDLCGLVVRLGFKERRRAGSHRIFRHAGRSEVPMVNLQRGSAGKAKPYQVRQVLDIVDGYGLEVKE